MMASSEYFSYFGRMASKHGITVIAPDLRGYGKSAGIPGAYLPVSAHLRDMESVVPENAFLLGHSLGASYAIEYALSHDVRGLILASPGFMLKPSPRLIRVGAMVDSVISGKQFNSIPVWPLQEFHGPEGKLVLSRPDLPKSFDTAYVVEMFWIALRSLFHLRFLKIPGLFIVADDDHVIEPVSVLIGFSLYAGSKKLIRAHGGHTLSWLFSLNNQSNEMRKTLALSIISWVRAQALSDSRAEA